MSELPLHPRPLVLGVDFTVRFLPIAPPHLTAGEVGRFADRVDISGGAQACWPWLGSRQGAGYGQLYIRGRYVGAHRIALEISLQRPLAPGMQACHKCDTPPCCNPLHLFEGSNQANVDDKVAKGRARGSGLRGELVGTHKLTAAAVAAIRSSRGVSVSELARQNGVSRTAIQHVLKGDSWRHVEAES